MINNKKCKMCGVELNRDAWFCPECKRINDRERQKASYAKKREIKKDFTNRKLARLKAMLEGVDLTPYLPKPEDQAAEAQDE
jgi:uncharacterized membrane protein YvbJ